MKYGFGFDETPPERCARGEWSLRVTRAPASLAATSIIIEQIATDCVACGDRKDAGESTGTTPDDVELLTPGQSDTCWGADSMAAPTEWEEDTFREPGSSLGGATSTPIPDVARVSWTRTSPSTRSTCSASPAASVGTGSWANLRQHTNDQNVTNARTWNLRDSADTWDEDDITR